jgi:hypothetical protein
MRTLNTVWPCAVVFAAWFPFYIPKSYTIPPVGTAMQVKSNAVNRTVGVWGEHTFARTLAAEKRGSGLLRLGVVLELGNGGVPPPTGSLLATLAGFSLRRLGSTPTH